MLDDVISAIDAETSQHIVQHCFKSSIMADRTVIIASHAVEALAPLANQAIFLDNGRAVWQGSGPQLLETEHMAHLKGNQITKHDDTDLIAEKSEDQEQSRSLGASVAFEVKEAISKTPKQLVMDEQRSKGNVDLNHWWDLVAFGGGHAFWFAMVFLLVISCLSPVAYRKVLQ